jgi:hypothetical protein
MPRMFERLRFARYALRFERAFKTDNWEPVKACFAPHAVYAIHGGSQYDGEYHGPQAIVDLFKRMLDELDRRFDKRIPGLRGLPRVSSGELVLPWKARYVKGARSEVLTGTSHCRFASGKIVELRDTGDPTEWARVEALLASAA